MSKVQKYIEDAVKATAAEITTKGVEISNINIDSGVHIHADEAIDVLTILAKAAIQNAETIKSLGENVVKTINTVQVENNSTGLRVEGVGSEPMRFESVLYKDDM